MLSFSALDDLLHPGCVTSLTSYNMFDFPTCNQKSKEKEKEAERREVLCAVKC